MNYLHDHGPRDHISAEVKTALIAAPTVDVVSLADVKAALGISGTSQDGMLEAAIEGIVSQLDPASGGWLGRALRPQTWELRLPGFRCERQRWHKYYDHQTIVLPFPPLISVTSVKYDDMGGVERTLVENTDFRVLGVGLKGKQSLAPLYNQSWPTARTDYESVRIRFQSGYAATPDEKMPAAIIQAVTMGVRAMLSNASNLFVTHDKVDGLGEKRYQVTAEAAAVAQMAMENLLGPYRVW